MAKITFDTLPQTIAELYSKIDEIHSILKAQSGQEESEQDIIKIDSAADFLGLKKSTLYSKVCKNEIPYMKQGRRLYFSKKKLGEYIHEGKVKSSAEVIENAHENLVRK